jgi:hypothetical protein
MMSGWRVDDGIWSEPFALVGGPITCTWPGYRAACIIRHHRDCWQATVRIGDRMEFEVLEDLDLERLKARVTALVALSLP